MGAYTNRALASYEMQNIAINAFSTNVAALTWTPATNGVVFVDAMISDMFGAYTSGRKQTCFTHACRHVFSQLSAESKVNDVVSFTRTGTWVTPNTTFFSNGSRSHTVTPASYCVIPFTGDSVVVTICGLDDATWGVGSTFSITAESGSSPQLPINGTCSDQGKVSTVIAAHTWVPMAIKISGFGAGAHSVRVTHTGSLNHWLVFDDALIPSTTPPTILAMKMLYCNAAYYATTSGQVSDAIVDTYNGILATVAAEFSNVHLVDASAGFDLTTMLHSDGAHKNDLGVYHQANAAMQVLAGLGWRNGQDELAVP